MILPQHNWRFGLRFYCFGPSHNQSAFLDMLKTLIPGEIKKRDQALDPLAAFGQARMAGGLPDFNARKDFSTGDVARSTAPLAGGVIRRLAASGMKMTDPAAQGVMGDFTASRGRAYDANMMDLLKQNEAAKQAGASNVAAVGAARNPLPALSMFGNAVYS